MKKMKKKTFALLCNTFIFALAFGVSLWAMPTKKAKADTFTVETIQMVEGASVRIGETGEHAEKEGLRFSLLVSKEYYESFENPVVGMYVLPAEKEIRDEEISSS